MQGVVRCAQPVSAMREGPTHDPSAELLHRMYQSIYHSKARAHGQKHKKTILPLKEFFHSFSGESLEAVSPQGRAPAINCELYQTLEAVVLMSNSLIKKKIRAVLGTTPEGCGIFEGLLLLLNPTFLQLGVGGHTPD